MNDDINAGARGKCPHCQTTVLFEACASVLKPGNGNAQMFEAVLEPGSRYPLRLTLVHCPACGKDTVIIEEGKLVPDALPRESWDERIVCWPRYGSRPPAPEEVPADIAKSYSEAALVLPLSPQASAALSRRCLQTVLRQAGFNQHDLSKQIDAALPQLPSYIAKNVDAIRNIGNFAAHPAKDTNSGEIIEVEPGEAEWNLDVLEQLFDFYYVQPATSQRKRDALNAKLQAANKPLMK